MEKADRHAMYRRISLLYHQRGKEITWDDIRRWLREYRRAHSNQTIEDALNYLETAAENGE